MASTARIDELKKKFDENPRRYFAPLANEFRKAGDIDQAILICEEFLPQQPGHMSGHIVYGQALYEAGRMPESRTVFETALSLDPENLIALRHLGDIARGQADHAAARNWYARVLDADPRNEEIQGLIATLDTEMASAVGEPAMEEPASTAPPAFSLGLDVEKEIAPFEAPIPTAEHALEAVDLPNADTAPFGMPAIPPIPRAPNPMGGQTLLAGFSLHGFDTPSAPAAAIHGDSAPAMGLESTAFIPPEEPIPETGDLDESLDSGVPSFSAPAERIESLAGLEGSGGSAHADSERSDHRAERAEFAPLDLDDGLVLPPHGDPLDPDAIEAVALEPLARESAEHVAPPIDFDLSHAATASDARGVLPLELAHDAAPSRDAFAESAPHELPPEVIAAEAALIDADETPAPPNAPTFNAGADAEPVARAPFVTETMAELYLAQGLPEQALSVYQHLLDAHPGDARLSGLVASMTPSGAIPDTGPTARDFFARLAGRRPGRRSAAAALPADDDFAREEEALAIADAPQEAPYSVVEAPLATRDEAQDEAQEEAVAEAEVQVELAAPADSGHEVAPDVVAPDVVAPAIERAAAMRTPSGSIDALFGNRSLGTSEDSAAAALAQAFGGDAEVPPAIGGRPARAASGELSLDSVFRDGPARPPRTSQSFSFDQFFTGSGERTSGPTSYQTSPELAPPGDAPAERSADDIEQFNSWLQGLKQR